MPKVKIRSLNKQYKYHQYELVKEFNSSEHCDIQWLCDYLKISRASYYKWLNRKETELDIENQKVLKCIQEIAQSNNNLFGTVKMTYAVNRRMSMIMLK